MQDDEPWHKWPYIIVHVSFLLVLASSEEVNKRSLNKGQISVGEGIRLQNALRSGKENLERSKDKAVPYVTYCNIFVRGHLDIGKMKGQDTGNSLILTPSLALSRTCVTQNAKRFGNQLQHYSMQ